MPYTKTLPKGKKESYEIKRIHISLDQKEVQGEIDHISYDSQNTPRVTRENFVVRNENEQLLDPSWNANSKPPKPENFDETIPDTWGGLEIDDIPRVTNPEKEYFDKLVAKTGSEGVTIYERIKRVIYSTLAEIKTLPTGDGWSVE